MKIADVKLTVLDLQQTGSIARIVPVSDAPRLRYERIGAVASALPHYESFHLVQTDDGIEGVCTASTPEMTPRLLEVLKAQVLGADPLCREELFQRLHQGTRLLHVPVGWFGAFDNCLWDIAGKVAGLPVCRLLGQVREAIPAYHTGGDGDGTLATYLRLFERIQADWGITAYKFHSNLGARANLKLFPEVRRAAGDDFTLINDAVCRYSLEEAIRVGRLMDDLGFRWLEEPMYEQEIRAYRKLCAALETMPVLATEMLMHDVRLCAQWLLDGATDLVRANARHGATGVVKLAHLAELHGTNVELNSDGGLAGHVHVQLQCAIANTYAFEHFGNHVAHANACGIANPPEVIDGQLRPSLLPGWGAVLDWDYIKQKTVAEY
jgi:L-alanine-DL-glutamate epimerase-like enolase superfamily enzyme